MSVEQTYRLRPLTLLLTVLTTFSAVCGNDLHPSASAKALLNLLSTVQLSETIGRVRVAPLSETIG